MYTPLVARHADTSYSVSVYVVSTLGIRPSLGSMNPIKECLHHFAREDAQKKNWLLLVSRILQYAGNNLPFMGVL